MSGVSFQSLHDNFRYRSSAVISFLANIVKIGPIKGAMGGISVILVKNYFFNFIEQI